jgi:hypothetical protein
MELVGFVFEIVLFAFGFFIYRFAIGKIRVHDTQRPVVERFRLENGGWMRIVGLLLMAMMAFEIGLHIFQWFKK